MASRKLTQARRIGLLIVPSEAAAAWTEAALEAARTLGWAAEIFLDRFPAELTGPALLATESWPDLQAFAPDDLIVIVPDTDDALATAQWVHVEGERLRYVSHRFAEASMAAAVAGQVISAGVEEIHIPGLGVIRRAGEPRLRRRSSPSPVSIYDAVPPPIGATAIWPLDLFQFPGGRPDRSHEIDLTGRARVVLFGPYIELPAGRWRMTFDFEVASAKVVPLRIEWGSLNGETITSEKIRNSGRYRVVLERDWPGIEPAEIRLYLDHAVFDGQLKPLQCEVTRVVPQAPTAAASPSSVESGDDPHSPKNEVSPDSETGAPDAQQVTGQQAA